MDLYAILFYVFAALAILPAFVVVFSRSIIYSAFALLFTFLGVAGLYVLLNADFIAVAQLMVYVGGILVLLIFGVMLTRKVTNVELNGGTLNTFPTLVVGGLLLGTLLTVAVRSHWMLTGSAPDVQGTTRELGELLLTTFILPFEVAGLLLLVAIMGAAFIARK
jgi:NADH-quinone oxidoreductase subunit J